MASPAAHLHRLVNEASGGALTREECESMFVHPASRALATSVLEALDSGHLVAGAREIRDGGRDVGAILDGLEQVGSEGTEPLRLQVRDLEQRVAAAEARLALVSHRKERMALLQSSTSKEQASVASYERTLQQSVVSEAEEVAGAEQDCLAAITELEASFHDLVNPHSPRIPADPLSSSTDDPPTRDPTL